MRKQINYIFPLLISADIFQCIFPFILKMISTCGDYVIFSILKVILCIVLCQISEKYNFLPEFSTLKLSKKPFQICFSPHFSTYRKTQTEKCNSAKTIYFYVFLFSYTLPHKAYKYKKTESRPLYRVALRFAQIALCRYVYY